MSGEKFRMSGEKLSTQDMIDRVTPIYESIFKAIDGHRVPDGRLEYLPVVVAVLTVQRELFRCACESGIDLPSFIAECARASESIDLVDPKDMS